ncbi:TfoX/Sxy family protein [Ruminiclostridium cellobioparum]|uniref:TfoX domain-containing protein n=1 Tax=Ruminiclostridium cellobioparum subsp. termitidis CT1112 TaxID=1195236 RepID=S0FQV3_RUMCE|nr:TfoX/Sxy family protein [Ruminiclostridium cellobioparum]EMS71559.1 TfoX domain-containing protein [Ruminiclostridium cellobioparum subsp. termitidis CT1112]
MGELEKLPNIGKEIERQLNEVGITTFEQLSIMGSRQAWLRIKSIDDSACINRLYGLEGAIRGIRWHKLPEEVKGELKEFYNKSK